MGGDRRDNNSSSNYRSSSCGGSPDVLVSCLKTKNWDKLLQVLQMGQNPNKQIPSFDVRFLLSSETGKIRCLEPYLDRYLLHNVTILHLAVLVNDLHAITVLLNFGAKINDFCGSRGKDLSVLMLAIVMGHSQLLDTLIRRGANYSLWNKDLHTPLDLSIVCNNTEAVRCLAKHRRFFYNNSQKSRLTICEYVRKYALPDRLEIVGRMVEIGYDLGRYADGSLLTLIMDKLQVSHKHTVRVFALLLTASPDLLSIRKKQTQETILHLAVRHSSLPLVHLSLERGISVSVTDGSGNSPLHCLPFDCLSADGVAILKELLDREADVFFNNDSGESPFEMAVRVQNPRLAAVFAEYFSKSSASVSRRFVIHDYLMERSGKSVDPRVLKSFLSYGLSFDAKNEFKQTTVHCLLSGYNASSADVLAKCLAILTQSDEMLDTADSTGMTPMMLAVHKNVPIAAIMKLIPANSIDQVTRDGQDIVSLLLTRYNVSEQDRMTLLKLVINKGVNLNNSQRFGCKALISASRQSGLQPLAEPLLLLRSGYLPQREDVEDSIEWDLQLLDHVLRHCSGAVVRSQFPNILLSVIANFIPKNVPLDLILKVVKKLTDEFHIDVNYFEKKTSVWHLMIGMAHRYPILPLVDHMLTVSNANLNLGVEWHEVGIPLTYALIVGEFKIAEKLIHRMSKFDHVCVDRMKLKFGFSGLLVSLCRRGFRVPDSFFERGFGQDMEIVKEFNWFRHHLQDMLTGNHSAAFRRVPLEPAEMCAVSSSHGNAIQDWSQMKSDSTGKRVMKQPVTPENNKKMRRQKKE